MSTCNVHIIKVAHLYCFKLRTVQNSLWSSKYFKLKFQANHQLYNFKSLHHLPGSIKLSKPWKDYMNYMIEHFPTQWEFISLE